jgi:hypothetical protein
VDAAIDWKVIAPLVERSYRCVACKRMLSVLDSEQKPH